MIDKKDKLINKFVKKDYNNELEEVLAGKDYEEDVKSLLLSMCYKIENSYKDYQKVKRRVLSKDEYIKRIISVIQKDCDAIRFVDKDLNKAMGKKTFLVDKQKKEIICYPIERKLLYSIAKIQKKENIVKYKNEIIKKTLTNLLNIGDNINTCEPLRDFNGFSWNIIAHEIENLMYNIIYQDLLLVKDYNFFDEWINNNKFVIDYLGCFEESLEENYGTELKENFMTILIKLSILLELKVNSKFHDILEKEKNRLEKEYAKFNDSEKYVLDLTNKKKTLSKKIKKIDQTINDKDLLDEEYKNRNDKLPLEKKIFSMKVLKGILQQEREDLLKKIDEYSNLLNPQVFIKKQNELKEKLDYFRLVDTSNLENTVYIYICQLQKCILKIFMLKEEKAVDKNEIINLLYEFRYYCQIPIEAGKKICDAEPIKEDFYEAQKALIRNSIQKKVIVELSDKEDVNIEILKNLFTTTIISLENISIKITKEKDGFYVQIFDEEVAQEKIKIETIVDKNDLKIKMNKKIKLFI